MDKFILEFFFATVGYLARKWFGEELAHYIFKPILRWLNKRLLRPVMHRLKKHLIKSERDAAIWLHEYNKALHKEHTHTSEAICLDKKCRLL